MAFMLGPVYLPDEPDIDILWIARTDKEALFKALPQDVVYFFVIC